MIENNCRNVENKKCNLADGLNDALYKGIVYSFVINDINHDPGVL